MSRKIIENGWNIGSLLTMYDTVDFTFKNKKPEEYNIRFIERYIKSFIMFYYIINMTHLSFIVIEPTYNIKIFFKYKN